MSTAQSINSCLIVGAGLAGLSAARVLHEHGVTVTLLDKGRGVGGRLATRRLDAAVCDHGAQFFTTRDERFAAWIAQWQQTGLAREWSRGFADQTGVVQADGHPRFCGTTGMNALAKQLAQGLDVRTGEQVKTLARHGNTWQAVTESGLKVQAASLILTPPVPQALALLDAGETALPADARRALERISYDPCFAVLAVLDQPSRIPAPGALRFHSGSSYGSLGQAENTPLSWIADNQQKGISPVPAVTLHATPQFTREHWEVPHAEVAEKLLAAAAPWLGATPRTYQVHRWRYSQPVVLHPERCLALTEAPPLIFAGDAFGGPRVEGAVLSGWAAAETLLRHGA